jgi:hypothetical protein
MNFIFKKINIVILAILPVCSADRSIIGWFAQSEAVHLFERHVQIRISDVVRSMVPFGYTQELASAEYQALGKAAQESLGIAQERHVPIRKIDPNSIMAKVALATAEADAIYINEEALKQRSYGAQRCGLLHEAVHKKYHDISVDQIIELFITAIGAFASYKLIGSMNSAGRYKILQGTASLVAGLIAASCVTNQYHHFMERRADIEGHYAAACSVCVQEAAVQRDISFNQQNNPLKHNGYLWAPDLEKIAADLARENKLCAYHNGLQPTHEATLR